MADRVVGSASVEVFADLAKLNAGLRTARRATDGAARDMAASARTARTAFERAGDGLTRSVRGARVEAERLNRELRVTDTSLVGIFAGIGAGAALTSVVRLADEYSNLRARIAGVAGEGEDAAAIFDRIFAAAQRNSVSLSALTTLYVRLRQSIAGLGDVEALAIGETLSQSLALSGASAQEAESFLRQISQALASGVLRGDEFNSVLESNARFARLLADNLGVGVGELRAMAEQGKITSDVIRGAIAAGGAEINAEFADLPLTIGRAYVQLENAITRYIGQTDQGLGASARFAAAIELLADNFDGLADALIVLASAGLANVVGRGIVAGAAVATKAGADFAASVRTQEAAILAQRARAIERMERQDATLAQVARQRAFIADQIKAAEAEIAKAQATLDRRLNEQAAPLPGDRRNRNPQKDFTQFTAAQRNAVRTYQEEVARLTRTIDNLRAADLREGAAAASAANVRRAAAASVDDLNTRLQVHTGVLATVGRATSTAARGLAAAFGSVVNVLGGPLPALLTAVAVGLIFYRTQAEQARQANDSLASALNVLARAAEPSAKVQEDAADAAGKSAEANDKAAAAAKRRAEEERALAEAQKLQAIATIQQAIADQQQLISRSRRSIATEDLAAAIIGPDPSGTQLKRVQAQQAAIAKAEESIRLLRAGVDSLASGERVLGAATAVTASATTEAALADAKVEASRSRRAAATEAAEKAERDLQTLIFETNRANQDGIDELDRKDAEAAEAKRERARRIIEDGTDDLTKLRREIEEIQDLNREGLFAGNAQEASRAMVDILVEMAYAAGDAAEALALLNQASLDPKELGRAAERIKEAAGAGRADRRERDNPNAIFRRTDIADAVKGGLIDGVNSGQWQDAFRNAVANALARAAERSLSNVVDMVFDSIGSGRGKGGGILGAIGSAIGSIFGGGKAASLPKRGAGGPVSAGTLYQVNETGRGGKELFLPNVDGAILSAGATNAALTRGDGGGRGGVQNIHVDLRGAYVEDLAAAEARLERAAQRGAMMGAELVQRQLRAATTI